jgi:hypothetical protein
MMNALNMVKSQASLLKEKDSNIFDLSIESELSNGLTQIIKLCNDKHEYGKRNQFIMINDGGINALHDLLGLYKLQSWDIRISVFNAMYTISKTNEEIRDFFEPWGNKKLCDSIEWILDNESHGCNMASETTMEDVLQHALTLAKCVSKSENNKGKYYILIYLIKIIIITFNFINIMYSYVNEIRHGRDIN